MNFLEIRDIGDGQVQVTWQRGNTVRPCQQPLPFEDPLTLEDKKELRWYLEDYLRFPYGAKEWQAQEVEKKMAAWGESLFEQVFSKCDFDPDSHTLYQEAVREGLDTCELCIVSEDTDFLNIPWELLRDKTPGRGYLAPLLRGLYRKRTGVKLEFPPLSSDEPFRILLVIARPYGKRDISFGTIARPMLEALRPLRPYVKLEVLRPPTFDALVKTLNANRGHYHLVHFDGHGVFERPSGSIVQFGSGGKGYLAFEKEDGTEDRISSDRLGQALATCRVPLFVLNACQSAEEGKTDSYASVASQLVAVGAKGVVAMSYSVYGVAASKFMERFYETLVNHRSLSEAVAQARLKLYADADRMSLVGARKLQDWMVPTLYQQEYDYVPIQKRQYTGEEPPKDVRKQAEEVCPEGQFGFIGRDYDILRIERCLLDARKPLVLLTGLGGSGKTELAYGFARWYAETEGCPGGVFATSFKKKGDFGQIVGSIVGYGTDFSRLPEEKQWQFLVQYLRDNPCLLIWDNFETVKGYPEGAVPLATDAEREKISLFLKALKNGKTRIIITTRKPHENWLKIAYTLIEIGGLTEVDAGQLAKSILETVGRSPEDFKDDPEYSRLLTLLRGHPRSLEVVLPHLRRKSPSEIIEALQHRIDEFGDVMDASLQYAFLQLSEQAQKHLPFVGLFTSYVNEGVLSTISSESTVYLDVIGESLDAAGWKKILEEATSVGLIRPVSGVYELHPTFPSFLRQKIISAAGKDGLDRLNALFLEFYGRLASLLYDKLEKGDLDALTAASIEEANFLRALHLAEMNDLWAAAEDVVLIIGEFYKIRDRTSEWAALRTRLLSWTGQEMSRDADTNKAHLWMYLLGDQADDARKRNELETAEESYQSILAYLRSLDDESVEPDMAVTYHQLGRIAQERQHFDEAEQWYRKALEIHERLELERHAAYGYHQLGMIAQERQQFDEAEQWYRKALEIHERLELERHAAYGYHQLGMIAQERQQFDEAEQWYRKALEIKERLELDRDAASDYHQLGRIAQERQYFDEAEQWYRKALEIYEQLELDRDAASDYHQLGRIAQERQYFDEAEQWYRKALEIYERLKLERDAATDYHQLGRIAEERQQFDEAEQWYRKALEIYERLKLERDAASDYHQLGMIAQERQHLDEAEQWYRKALEIRERLKLERDPASDYHQLGIIAQERQQFDEAEQWYRKALEIRERLKLERDAASDYHQLGMIAQERQHLDEAEQWYRKALEIRERLKLERDPASDYHQLGIIAQERQQFDEAEQWYRRALEIFERLGHPPYKVNTLAQLGMLYREKNQPRDAVRYFGKAFSIAAQYEMKVIMQILVDLARIMNTMGEEDFADAWKEAFEGQEPPIALIREIMEKLK